MFLKDYIENIFFYLIASTGINKNKVQYYRYKNLYNSWLDYIDAVSLLISTPKNEGKEEFSKLKARLQEAIDLEESASQRRLLNGFYTLLTRIHKYIRKNSYTKFLEIFVEDLPEELKTIAFFNEKKEVSLKFPKK